MFQNKVICYSCLYIKYKSTYIDDYIGKIESMYVKDYILYISQHLLMIINVRSNVCKTLFIIPESPFIEFSIDILHRQGKHYFFNSSWIDKIISWTTTYPAQHPPHILCKIHYT